MTSEYLRWPKFWAAEEKASESYETGPMKTKGFTLIELVVACTLLMILSTVATTSVDSLVQSFKQLNATNQALTATNKTLTYRNQVWTLKFMLTQAELNYAAATTDPVAFSHWNTLVSENDSIDLIPLIAQYFQIPAITDFTSLLQFENMYDPKGVIPNPTIQLASLTTTTPPMPVGLPTITWQGMSL
jgi:type II secretory pathway pseudopilin PulG